MSGDSFGQAGASGISSSVTVLSRWRVPASDAKQATLRITLNRQGEVQSVVITQSSGDEAFDASIRAAVERAAPFPVPDDDALFARSFRTISFTFKKPGA